MRTLVQADLDRDGISFIPRILFSSTFRTNGVVYGRSSDCWWAVLDPLVHPLYIWNTPTAGIAAYSKTARALDAAIFTNGLMPGKRFAPDRKVTRTSAIWEFVKQMSIGAAGGLAAARGTRFRYLCGFGGAAAGFAYAWWRTFTNWLPCGGVYSATSGIDDRQNFDNEASRHSWFGRLAEDFNSYRIGEGDLPAGVIEGLGGLILLIRDFMPASKWAGDPTYNRDFAELAYKKGVVAWGLVPLDRHGQGQDASKTQLDGVIVVFGSRKLDAEVAAARLCSIGTRDAVATDQRASIMMGAHRQFMIGPPPLHRQAMQSYGIYCR